jgi:hypothetical protein
MDSAGCLRGKLWGRVNYTWKGCDRDKRGHVEQDHYHVVWQRDGRLMRDCIRPRDFTKLGYRGGDMQLERAAFNLLILKRVLDDPFPAHPEWDNGLLLKVQGIEVGFTPADFRHCEHYNTIRLFDWRDGMVLYQEDRKRLEYTSEKLDVRVEEAKLVTAYRKVSQAKDKADQFNRSAARTKMEVEALDQLYIAV